MKFEVKLNKFLKSLNVTYNEFTDEFIIRRAGADEVIAKIDYNDFPHVYYDVNSGKLFVKIEEIEELEKILAKIVEYVENTKEKIEKIDEKLKTKRGGIK